LDKFLWWLSFASLLLLAVIGLVIERRLQVNKGVDQAGAGVFLVLKGRTTSRLKGGSQYVERTLQTTLLLEMLL